MRYVSNNYDKKSKLTSLNYEIVITDIKEKKIMIKKVRQNVIITIIQNYDIKHYDFYQTQ